MTHVIESFLGVPSNPPPVNTSAAPTLAPVASSSSNTSPASSTTFVVDFKVDVVHTNFDRLDPVNTRFTASRDREQNIKWTNAQRKLAENGIEVKDVDHLRYLVSAALRSLWEPS